MIHFFRKREPQALLLEVDNDKSLFSVEKNQDYMIDKLVNNPEFLTIENYRRFYGSIIGVKTEKYFREKFNVESYIKENPLRYSLFNRINHDLEIWCEYMEQDWADESMCPFESLNFSNGIVSWLPKYLGRLKTLKDISLFGCKITFLPDSFSELESLESINMQEMDHLMTMPEDIGKLKNLKKLEIFGSYRILRIPDSFKDCISLENLDWMRTSVQHIPEGLIKLPKLERLDLTGNKIKDISHILDKPKSVLKINLMDNPLDDIEGIENLESGLNIITGESGSNGVNQRHKNKRPEIRGSAVIKYLYGKLYSGEIGIICEGIREIGNPEIFLQLKDDEENTLLFLNNFVEKYVLHIPIYNIRNRLVAEILDYNWVRLTSLFLSSTLDLSLMGLNRLPKMIYKMPLLMTLTLKYNNIKVIDPEIGLTKRLRELDLKGNNLTNFPFESFKSRKAAYNKNKIYPLDTLNLSSNPLIKRPKKVKNIELIVY